MTLPQASCFRQNNMPIPASAAGAFSTGDTNGQRKPVNPITGQFFDMEEITDAPEMTEEGNEREAEKLFVLFEWSVTSTVWGHPLAYSSRLEKNV